MRRIINLVLVLGMVLTLGACASASKDDDDLVQVGGTEGVGSENANSMQSLDDPSSPLSKRVIYFEFDSSTIQSDYQELISAHAAYLVENPDVSIVLEGHADERGTREYNIALGERRAKAVRQLMTLQGVTEKQLQVISFGEERPVALGHDESAWSLNRRVEILYSGQ
ncbi:MAG: peptidoglycan-associated lipoprotein Pal [Gammaproteobacteria bacterium]|nr:peptidoglycan-associated lipoprotein Pal [Gammaproteobacteria bacterium]MDH5777714.1 peptidoglycan-associated lipoprotein Pal [Gammaproteobacteria bacterium]